jgi:hypothetical protein
MFTKSLNWTPVGLFEKTAMWLSEAVACARTLMPVMPVNRVVDKKRIIGKNGGPRRRRGTGGQ